MTPPDERLAELLTELRPAELALRDWVRTRLNASIMRDIATLDYGMQVEENERGIDELLAGRLPADLPWPPREVLELSSHADLTDWHPAPGTPGWRGHIARLFSCLMLVRADDTSYPAGALAGLVESALALGPDATSPALRYVAWCRLREPGSWRYDPESRPFLTLGVLLLYAMAPDHDDPAVEARLREAFVAEVRALAEWPGQPPTAAFKAAAGSERRRTWRTLVAYYVTGLDEADDSVATLRTWFAVPDRPTAPDPATG